MALRGPVVSRNSYIECNKCGKVSPVGLGHACHPYKKYNRSARKWVNKTLEEYSKIEKENDIEYKVSWEKIIKEWNEEGFSLNLNGKPALEFDTKPTYFEFREIMSGNGWHIIEEKEGNQNEK